MISLLTGVKVSDCTNGYRAIRVSELHKLNLREDRFNANEIILEALKHKLRFEQVPVSMMSRAAGETKKPPKLAYPLGLQGHNLDVAEIGRLQALAISRQQSC